MGDTTGEVRKDSKTTFSDRLLALNVPVLADLQGHQLCVDTACRLENLPEATDDGKTEKKRDTHRKRERERERERERIRELHAIRST